MCCWLFSTARTPPPPFLVQPSGPIPVIVSHRKESPLQSTKQITLLPLSRNLVPGSSPRGGRVGEVPGQEVLTRGVARWAARCSRGTAWMAHLVFLDAIHSTKIIGSCQNSMDRFGSDRKRFEKIGPPIEVDHFSRSDRLEFRLNGSRPYERYM